MLTTRPPKPLTKMKAFYRCYIHFVEVWSNFVHSCTVYCSGLLSCRTLEGQGCSVEPECTLCTSQTPPQTMIYMSTHSNYFLSQLTNRFQTLLALFIACTGVHCGLKYQHWHMKQTLFVNERCCQWQTIPTYFRQN
jgi:hypothetical protein